MLLAGLQGEDIAALARGVYRLADDPAGQASDERRPRGEEPVVRPAVRLVVPRRLALADRDRAAVLARRFQDAEVEAIMGRNWVEFLLRSLAEAKEES